MKTFSMIAACFSLTCSLAVAYYSHKNFQERADLLKKQHEENQAVIQHENEKEVEVMLTDYYRNRADR